MVTRAGFDATNLYWGCPSYRFPFRRKARSIESDYLEDLKSVAASFGYEPEVVDRLLACGHQPEEIEEFLYEM